MKFAVVLGLAAWLVTGCGTIDPDDGSGYVSADGLVRIIAESDRESPVELAGEDMSGAELRVSPRAGRATVINVWWSGCAECRAEAPLLREAAADPKLAASFFGINIRDASPAQGQRFEEKFGIDYPSFYDPGGRLVLEFNGKIPYSAIPTTVVLDEQLRVGAVIIGEIPSVTTLREAVRSVA